MQRESCVLSQFWCRPGPLCLQRAGVPLYTCTYQMYFFLLFIFSSRKVGNDPQPVQFSFSYS